MTSKSAPSPSSGRMATRRAISNRIARYLISIGGIGVIAVVVAIFVFIAYETLPIWQGGEFTRSDRTIPSGGHSAILAGINEYRTTAFTLHRSGVIQPLNLIAPTDPDTLVPLAIQIRDIAAADYDAKSSLLVAVDSSSRFSLNRIAFSYSPLGGYGSKAPVTVEELWSERLEEVGGVSKVKVREKSGSELMILIYGGDAAEPKLWIANVTRSSSFFGESEIGFAVQAIGGFEGIKLRSIALERSGGKVVAGTDDGRLLDWDLRGDPGTTHPEVTRTEGGSAISALEFLSGGQTIIVGDETGSIQSFTWVLDSDQKSGLRLVPLNKFEGHQSAVTSISSSQRNKTFLSGDAKGEIAMHYQTTGKTLDKLTTGNAGLEWIMMAPKSDGFVSLSLDNLVRVDSIHSPHPEISLGVLFGKVQYEGYAEPTYTWQSTGGSDDFEPKLSLVPLLAGTLKGAFYALIFGLPIAILSAIYTALFAHPKIKNIIKPTVEIMAALPSVVIGFIAALWLAPFLERMLVSVLLMGLLLPLGFVVSAVLWHGLPKRWTSRWPVGSELALIVPGIVGVVFLGIGLASPIETALLGGNARQWLFDSFGITYDQRNSIVVGFAMGFAVIPIIFTISEDSLSSVPEHLAAGSLALGATRWQTAMRVVLPTASPGIFSAAMVGFGRAVGETMIVLMATGNTPLMSFSPFVGMRTLSANIAVEIPEAPHLGTLYRVLFVSGLLLFAFTFVINTVAEVIRQRLRRRYSTI